MDSLFKRKGIYWIVILISLLLIAKLFVAYNNSRVIDRNVRIQKEAEKVKVNTLDVLRTLHELDLGIRGYALAPGSKQLEAPYDLAWVRKEQVFKNLEEALTAQNFEMKYLYKLRDSVDAYFDLAKVMLGLLKTGDRKSFDTIFKDDPGFQTWLCLKTFSARIDAFEDSIMEKSKAEYERALQLNYSILAFMLILIVPTLFYTAFQSVKTFSVLDALKESERQRSHILETQNVTLERLVQERTDEITAQNEEIMSQNEEITTHNETLSAQRDEILENRNQLDTQNRELRAAQKVIEDQSEIIRMHNVSLLKEVEHRTESLTKSNKELVQNISQLEQFTFIVSHNLRAPVARILGLGAILNIAKTQEESAQIKNHLVKTAQELDGILNDLSLTIQLKRMENESLQPVDLTSIFAKVKNILQPELQKCKALLKENLLANQLNTVSAYIESILYNLISNAIKYRNPEKGLVISVNSCIDGEYLKLEVQDNGLGIDLEKHDANLFNMYKRFHFHVEGKGLGLYLVKTQVTLLGGDISVTSKVGEGARFIVRIQHHNVS